MIMIPSVGYFTSITKCDAAYAQFIDDQVRHLRLQNYDTINEDTLLEKLIGEVLADHGWKISFITETEVYF